MDSYLPARYSMNTFFVRHVANPKRLKHIEGLNRAPICSVVDEGYFPSAGHKSTFPPNNFNEAVIKSNNSGIIDVTRLPRKKEKFLPPQGRFQAYGIIDDTDRWKDELGSLAVSVGLLTETDIEKARRQKEREKYIQSLEQAAQAKPSSSQPASPKKPQSSYSRKTSRLNEPLLTGRRTSRGSQASRGFSGFKPKYVVDENEREVWMLQVLCQILQTDNLVDVQSWLVSSNHQEKDHVRHLIDSAMKGLESTGRIENANAGGYFTPKPNGENKPRTNEQQQQQPQIHVPENAEINLDRIQNMIEKMNLKSANIKNDANRFSRHLSASGRQSVPVGTQNVYKLPEISEFAAEHERRVAQSQASKPLESIPENDATAKRLADTTEYQAPLSPVFNINIYSSAKKPATATTERNQSSNTNLITEVSKTTDNTVISVQAPAKDFKIEELNVTMVVKDEKTHQLQKINGNWKPESSIPPLNPEN